MKVIIIHPGKKITLRSSIRFNKNITIITGLGGCEVVKGCKISDVFVIDIIPDFDYIANNILLPCMIDVNGYFSYCPDNLDMNDWLNQRLLNNENI